MELTFRKGDITRFAHSPAEAVQLRADGWIELSGEPETVEVIETTDEQNQSDSSNDDDTQTKGDLNGTLNDR